MGYFGYGISASAGVCFMLRNNMKIANMGIAGWALPLIGGIAALIGCHSLDYQRQFPAKALCYTAFVGCQGLLILPLIQYSTTLAVGQACLATGATMASLSTVAMMAPSE